MRHGAKLKMTHFRWCQNIKGQVHTGHSNWRWHWLLKMCVLSALWLHAYLMDLLCVINTTHEVTLCYTPYRGQYIKGQIQAGNLKLFHVCSVAPCLFDWNVKPWSFEISLCRLSGSIPFWPNYFTCSTNINHELMMCQTPFPSQNSKVQSSRLHG